MEFFFYRLLEAYNRLTSNNFLARPEMYHKEKGSIRVSTAPLQLIKGWMGFPEAEEWEIQ